MTDDDIEVIKAENTTGFSKKQKKTITQNVLNNRGRKWFRDQLGLTTVISGVAFLSGLSFDTWLGMNLLCLPVTAYYAKKNYSPLSKELRADSEVSENEEDGE